MYFNNTLRTKSFSCNKIMKKTYPWFKVSFCVFCARVETDLSSRRSRQAERWDGAEKYLSSDSEFFFFLNYILHDSKSENFAKERLSKVEKTKYSAPHINDKFVSIEKKSKYSLKKIDYCLFWGLEKKFYQLVKHLYHYIFYK